MNPSILAIWLRQQIEMDAVLGPLLGERVFPDKAPEGTPNPCLIYQLLGEDFEELLDAGPLMDTGYTFQLRAYASTRFQANQIREHLRLLLQGRCGLHDISCEGETHRLRIGRSHLDGYADSFDEESGDYGSLSVWACEG